MREFQIRFSNKDWNGWRPHHIYHEVVETHFIGWLWFELRF